jgi:hypothetical protein
MWDSFLDFFSDSPPVPSTRAPPATECALELTAIATSGVGATFYAPVPAQDDEADVNVPESASAPTTSASHLAWYNPSGCWAPADVDPMDILSQSVQCLHRPSDTPDCSPALTWLTFVLTRAPSPCLQPDDVCQWAPLLDLVMTCYSHALIVVDSDEFRNQCRPLGTLSNVASLATLIKVRVKISMQ